jgi:hypothetical protein
LLITLNDILSEKYYSKYKCTFNPVNHKELISKLKIIEEELISKYNFVDKIPQFKIYEQLTNGNIKMSVDIGNKSSCNLILKISGIWETQEKYGLTFKFMKIN